MSSENARLLLVMAKEPRAGSVKTRLAAKVGKERAAELALAFLEDTLVHAAAAAEQAKARLALLHDPADEATHDAMAERARALSVSLILGPQLAHPSLGVRLEKAFRRAFDDWRHVVVIGTDSPDLAPDDYVRAFEVTTQAVLGPARDGGYWLVGLKRDGVREPERALLDTIAWSTETALADTRAAFERRKIALSLLDAREDVDELPSLLALIERLRADPSRAPRTARALEVGRPEA